VSYNIVFSINISHFYFPQWWCFSYNYNYNIHLYSTALQCCPGALNSVTNSWQ